MKVIVGCERSRVVAKEFERLGHIAYSCDLAPAQQPGRHIQGDVLDQLEGMKCESLFTGRVTRRAWDLLICHPDCTYLTCSAEWAYKDGPYHMKLKPGTLTGAARWTARMAAVDFVMEIYNSDIPKVCIENPVGYLSSKWRKPDQIIQPYEFGDDASKATCLWLRGLPKLMADPAKRKAGRMVIDPRTGKLVERWANQTDGGQNNLTPSNDRAMKRAITYNGVARAMAEQWGSAAQATPATPPQPAQGLTIDQNSTHGP